ncbi:MAG: hypothetical protein D6725_01280 [Planctomycetota bacterium]|nr:MAG: hypothetical protein D6725_01280 [Planctomycetota bacterium]
MKPIKLALAVVATFGLSGVAQAGLFNFSFWNAEKSCSCTAPSKSKCSRPTITRPCPSERPVYTYQRQPSKLVPPCTKPGCCTKGTPGSCTPCKDRGKCAPSCKAPQSCAPAAKSCTPAAKECAPAARHCAAPAPKACDAKGACDSKGARCVSKGSGCTSGCTSKCTNPCDKASRKCNVDPCEIAELIYKSQTACYAKQRRAAIDKLGDHFDCVCSPEIMAAFIYALNDADERVRAEAADEIGDQLRRSKGCCCSKEVIEALTCALGDCDKHVRREAEKALEACGYKVVDGVCKTSCTKRGCTTGRCTSGCTSKGCDAAPKAAPPAPENGIEPSPGDNPPAPATKSARSLLPSRLVPASLSNGVRRSTSKLRSIFNVLD